jgi:hypothetical protein
MEKGLPFAFDLAVDLFEKAGAETGKERRIGGMATLGTEDQQKEKILQRGLDFSSFITHGWFNDNHSKATTDILGYPEEARYVRKGEMLPSGKAALADGHWVEGYLLNTEKADKVWELGQALQKTNRRLGFSVEGSVQKRAGFNKSIIAEAKVRNVAITNCPVHQDARMEILTKSIEAIEQARNPDELWKMLSMGAPTNPGGVPEGSRTGEGAGEVLAEESLEHDEKPNEKENKKACKSLTDSQAIDWLKRELPNATEKQLARVVTLTRQLKAAGKL